jgi:exonuclease VII small subunit
MKLAKECSDKIKESEKLITKIMKENGSLEDFKIEE